MKEIDSFLSNHDQAEMRHFTLGDALEDNNEVSDDGPEEFEPIETLAVDPDQFIGIHPNHLKQVRRQVGNSRYFDQSYAGRLGGGED